jgi:hypothetical protein
VTGPTAVWHTALVHGVGSDHTPDDTEAPSPGAGGPSEWSGMALRHVMAVAFAGLRHMAAMASRP